MSDHEAFASSSEVTGQVAAPGWGRGAAGGSGEPARRPGRMAAARHEFRSAILIGQTQTAARAGPLMRKHHTLARRLREREDDYLRFATDPRAPFDNNAAEREIRMGKLRIKVSGCMRSMAGAENFCAIRSYLSTAKKHGIGILDALTQAATETAWIPAAA
jgi:transposase